MFSNQIEDEGDKLFRQSLIKSGFLIEAVDIIISNWTETYRRHCKRLEEFAEYLKQVNISQDDLLKLKNPQTLIINFLTSKMTAKHTDASIKAARTAISVLFSFIGYKDDQIHTPAITQLMKGVEQRTRKVKQEEQMWDLSLLWILIEEKWNKVKVIPEEQKITIIMILIMIYTNLRLKELHRAELDLQQINQDIVIIKTVVIKGDSGQVKLTLRKSEKDSNCIIRWIMKWRKDKAIIKQGKVWRNQTSAQNYTYENCSRLIRNFMIEAGVPRGQRVTSIRASAITKAINLGASMEEVNRWSRHAETANTVMKFYDRNNNEAIRKMIQL